MEGPLWYLYSQSTSQSVFFFSLSFRWKCCWSLSRKHHKPASSRGFSAEWFLLFHFECGRRLSHAYNSVPRQMCARHPQSWQPIYWDKQRLQWPATNHWKTEQLWDLLYFLSKGWMITVFSIESKCGIMSTTSKIGLICWQHILLEFPATLWQNIYSIQEDTNHCTALISFSLLFCLKFPNVLL